jgi:chromate transport protein ChrA
MHLKKGILAVSLFVIIFYLLSKRKQPTSHSENFIFEIAALLVVIIAIITTLKIGRQNDQKITHIINIAVGVPLAIYLFLVFGQQVFLIDKINFGLIMFFIGVSIFQSASLFLKRT